ncbi:secreted ookinete protein, putative [Plasmodium gallinaceum]|uniref:Secreted ookinete protein, putative n=1 Tax=Plasmodium gallinaceum TaxID=5849 RepID=A0A1J1GZ93_PLAGA|nr:secreted ookinete protein, putative [Plasmodium gallinaceum]CRG97916.1 secreted ookinete protein, putative [Plasmodium gallinaceum]
MLLLRKLLFILFLAFLFFNKTRSYYFKIINENIFKRVEDVKCFRQHYVNFKDELILVCLYFESSIKSEYKYNIHIYKIKEGNTWEKKYQLLKEDTNKIIRYFYSFSTEDKIVVVFCYNKLHYRVPCECYYSTSYDGDTFESKRTSINYEIFDILSLTDYYLKPFEFFGNKFLLICGINYKRIIHDDSKLFIICHGSDTDGKSWNYKFNFYYPKTYMYSSYYLVVPKISGNEIGFRFFISSHIITASYVKCIYRSMYDFDCSDVEFKIEGKILRDVVKVGGYYLTNHSDDKLSPCQLYYRYKSVILAPTEAAKSEGKECFRDHFFPLDNSRLIYNYKNENFSYSYVFRYIGSVKHCTLLYIKKDNLNPGFTRGSDSVYTCSINYDEIIVDQDDRYFVLSVLNEVKTDLKKCFHLSYDNLLYPVNIIHKIDIIKEYNKYKLYIFHIKKDMENYFFKDTILYCDLGDNFFIKLHLNYKNNFILDNTANLPEPLTLHNNNIIYYKLPNLKSKNLFLSNVSFPPNTKYIKEGDSKYIFKLPPYIKDTVENNLYFINESMKTEKKSVIIHAGGKIPELVGVDFSKMNDNCSYGYTSNKCDNIKIEGNKISVDITVHADSQVILGMICPVDSINQNICFNDVYDNDKKVFIRDFFEDDEGLLTILPKTYVYIPDSSETYEESNLIMEKRFIEKIYKNKSHYKSSFVCKCYAHKKHYEVTFKLT